VRIDKESTTIIDGAGEKKDIEARIGQIKAQIEETTPITIVRSFRNGWPSLRRRRGDPRRRRHRSRSEGKKDRVDDALNATARRGGRHFSGGGVALLRSIKALENLRVENHDQKTGVDIVRKAIQAPARQIVDNAGADGAVWSASCSKPRNITSAMMHRRRVCDLVKLGIIDPTKVVRTALQDAASIAGLIVTTEATITEHPKAEAPAMPAAAWAAWRYGLLKTRCVIARK